MAKAAATVDSVCVTYNLRDLPTAQHKAGLAGLVMQIHDMGGRRDDVSAVPRIEDLTPSSARIHFYLPGATIARRHDRRLPRRRGPGDRPRPFPAAFPPGTWQSFRPGAQRATPAHPASLGNQRGR
jgi:hypothetical protein